MEKQAWLGEITHPYDGQFQPNAARMVSRRGFPSSAWVSVTVRALASMVAAHYERLLVIATRSGASQKVKS